VLVAFTQEMRATYPSLAAITLTPRSTNISIDLKPIGMRIISTYPTSLAVNYF
jgi:hypothetical protein